MLKFLHIFDITIPMFNLMIALGLFFSILSLYLRSKNNNKIFFLETLSFYYFLLIISYFFGEIYYNLVYHKPSKLSINFSSGNSIVGSLIGVTILIYIISRFNKKILEKTDFVIPSFLVLQFIGKIGCSFAGCCYGFAFSGCCSIMNIHNTNTFPIQIFEAAGVFAMLIYFNLFYNKMKIHISKISLQYLFLYSFLRFIAEYFRNDSTYHIYFHSLTQIIILMFFLLTSYLLLRNIIIDIKVKNKEIFTAAFVYRLLRRDH